MANRYLILLLLFAVVSCSGGQISLNKDISSPTDESAAPEPSLSAEGPVVKIGYNSPEGGTAFIKVESSISSSNDLMEYKEVKNAETQTILELTKEFPADIHYPSVVTFAAPVASSKIEEIAKTAGDGASIRMVRFVSTRGGGQVPYEMVGSQAMLDLESRLKEIQKVDNTIDDFKLIEGVSSFKGGLNRGAVESLMADSDTFVVDIGPAEMYENGIQAAWDDVAEAVARYGGQ